MQKEQSWTLSSHHIQKNSKGIKDLNLRVKTIEFLDFIKIKNFFASKDIIKKVRKFTKWEKLFVNDVVSFISRIYKELLQAENAGTCL
jgi:hypothetical protein